MADKKKLDDVDINRIKAAIGDIDTEFKEEDINKIEEVVGSSDDGRSGEVKKEQKIEEERSGDNVKENPELFVKIDEHKEIANELIEARKEMKAVAETIDLLAKAESLKEEAIRRMEKHVEKLEEISSRVAKLLDQPGRFYPQFSDVAIQTQKSEFDDLKNELERLKSILENMK